MKVSLLIEQKPNEEDVVKAKKWKQQLENSKSSEDKRKIIQEIKDYGLHITSDWNNNIGICIPTSINLASEYGMKIALETLNYRK